MGPFLAFILCFATMEHVTELSSVHTRQDKKTYHGMQAMHETQLLLDDHLFYLQPRGIKFSHGKGHLTGLGGWRYTVNDSTFGMKAAYDLTNMSYKTFHQLSFGLEFIRERLGVELEVYRPWPGNKKTNAYQITSYPHTDLDFSYQGDHFCLYGGPTYVEEEIGGKIGLIVHLWRFSVASEHRYDPVVRGSHRIVFSFGVFPEKRAVLKKPRFILVKTKKIAPLVITPPQTSLLIQQEAHPPMIGPMPIILEGPSTIDEEKNKKKEDSWWPFSGWSWGGAGESNSSIDGPKGVEVSTPSVLIGEYSGQDGFNSPSPSNASTESEGPSPESSPDLSNFGRSSDPDSDSDSDKKS